METTLDQQTMEDPQKQSATKMPVIIPAAIVWHIFIAIGLAVLSINIFSLDTFFNLGRPVQVFAGIAVLLPAIAGLYAGAMMWLQNGSGRYLSLAINFSGMAFALFALLGIWGVYNSFERLVDIVMSNGWLNLGFALAYGLFWLSGRFSDESRLNEWLQMGAVGLGSLTLIVMLLRGAEMTDGTAFSVLDGAGYIITRYGQMTTWIVTLVVAVFAFFSWRLLKLGSYFGETPAQRDAWQGWLMLSPNILGFLLFFAGPLLLSFYLSFTNSAMGQIPEVIGFANYGELLALELKVQDDLEANPQEVLSFGYATLGEIEFGESRLVLGARDTRFWISMRNTFVFVILLIPLAILPALGMSLVLNSSLPGVKFYRAIYFLPSVAAVVGTALIWRWLYDPTIGIFNFAISSVVDWLNTLGFNIQDPNIQWLTGPGVVLLSIVFLSAWQVVGYNTVLFLAGLQGIPHVLYEAAQIDGASRWQQFRNVTLPLLAPTTFFVMITTMVTGLQVFNEPFALFPARPIPEQATTAVFYMYDVGFPQGLFGYSSSVAWLLFVIIFGLTLIQFRLNRNEAYE